MDEEFPRLPLVLSPSKSPAPKKKAQKSAAVPLKDDYSRLADLINNRADDIERKITGLNNKVDALADNIKAVSAKMAVIEKRVDLLEQPVKALQRQIDELESYSRRCNLKLLGVRESDQENLRQVVIKTCQMVAPSMKEKFVHGIDEVHRLGKIRQEMTGPRPIIFHFTSREYKDAVWKAGKESSYLKEHGLQLDFSKGDQERRQRLYPEVQKARAAGKVAYYSGARAFIKGEGEIILPDM